MVVPSYDSKTGKQYPAYFAFNDEDYLQRVFDVTHLDANILETIQTAFNIAHEIRRFEIELFWKRGTYFWAFILASFTAYFATIDKILDDGSSCSD